MKIYWSGESKNIIGQAVLHLRKERGWSQKFLAQQLQLRGFDCTDLTVLRIEGGKRFVPDYEVKALAEIFEVPYEALLDS